MRGVSVRGSVRGPGLLSLLLLAGACFDSDEQYVPAAASTSTTGVTTGAVDSTSTSGSSSTTAEPENTCRDAIQCVQGCAVQLQVSMLPEPDFTCFLECEEGLTSEEVLDLFRLTECVTNECIALDQCDILVPSESTGEESSSSSSGGGSSSTGDTDGTRPPLCLNCVMARLLDPQLGGECGALAAECQ